MNKKWPPLYNYYLITGVLVPVTIISYFYFDKPLAYFFNERDPSPLWNIVNILLTPFPNILFWPTAFFFVRFILKKENWGEKFLLIALSVGLVNVLLPLLKRAFGRYRPSALFSENLYGFNPFTWGGDELSFPSGHTFTIAAILFSLACLYPRKFWWFALLSFVLAFGRVATNKHFLSDVTGSLIIALWLVHFVFIAMRKEGWLE